MITILCFALFLALTHGQIPDCKCGGKYANGRAVTGCTNGGCARNSSSRCVIIYRESSAIGYDCIPWPAQVGNCAIFDDGSRVCADDACKPNLLGGDKGDCSVETDDSSHVIVAAQVNRAGLDFAMDAIRRQAEIEVMKAKIPDQKIQQMGMTVTITDIRIAEFTSPTFTYELQPPSSVKIFVKGGDFKVCTNIDAKLGFLPSAGGQLCVWSENKKGVDVQVKATVALDSGKIALATSECGLKVPIDLSLTGAVGTLITPIRKLIENIAQSQASSQVCKLLDNTVRTTLKTVLDELPTNFKVDSRYGLGYKLHSIRVIESGVKAQFAVNGTFSEK